MQITVIAYTNTEENKKQIILQGAGEKKLKIYFWQFQLLILNLQLQKSEKNPIKKIGENRKTQWVRKSAVTLDMIGKEDQNIWKVSFGSERETDDQRVKKGSN